MTDAEANTDIVERLRALVDMTAATLDEFRSAGVRARLYDGLTVRTRSPDDLPEVSGWFTSGTIGSTVHWTVNKNEFRIYTLTLQGMRVEQVKAATVRDAVDLARANPILASGLGLVTGTIETGGELYQTVRP